MLFVKASGLFGIPLLILTCVIVGLIVQSVLRTSKGVANIERLANVNFAILFWGFFSAVIGFLGQSIGLYNALIAISGASEISPTIISRGFAESFSTTLWGTGLLILSGLAWLILKTWQQSAAKKLVTRGVK